MIELRHVSVHNLKGIDLDLPTGQLIVFCGRSGSGKSSLAMDTLYAEGQRRYIETFSAYTRQFLEKIERPDARRIDGLPPAIAVAGPSQSGHGTVGSATETADHLRLLFAKIGNVFCPKCDQQILVDTPQSILHVLKKRNEQKYQIVFAPELPEDKSEFEMIWRERGFVRGFVRNEPFRLDEGGISDTQWMSAKASTSGFAPPVTMLVDRLTHDSSDERFVESLETALDQGQGTCYVLADQDILCFSAKRSCNHCRFDFPPLEPKLFRANNAKNEVLENFLPEALAVKIGDKNIADLSNMTIAEADGWFQNLRLEAWEQKLAAVTLAEIRRRLDFLLGVGLGYLTLSRPLGTLSGGEQRRVGLTSALSSSLVDMLYVLDEPSVGLHPLDTERLLETIKSLRNRGNTVVVIEHEDAFLRAADHLVEIGPGAGESGGNIVFQGTPEEIVTAESSLTGPFLAGTRYSVRKERRRANRGEITLTGCRSHNLKDLTVTFPLGMLCVVTGVSGAGKSSLVRDTLYPALSRHLHAKNNETKKRDNPGLPLDHIHISGPVHAPVEDVLLIDQTPLSRSPRSNPATYLKIFDEIRNVFAATTDAKARNLTPGKFSFNVEGGRCEHCKGDGFIVVDMQFMADVNMRCPECFGKRYRPEILEILYRGQNIADVLDMTAREAFAFFRGQRKVQQKLKCLFDAGLDYIRLGQPANTLSGGEAQRLKLALYLSLLKKERTLFIMDEPTTGLHFADIVQLLDCFEALLETGHSLIIVEHNLQLIQAADYVIDLGPGAAELGGTLVAEGTPEEVAQKRSSPPPTGSRHCF